MSFFLSLNLFVPIGRMRELYIDMDEMDSDLLLARVVYRWYKSIKSWSRHQCVSFTRWLITSAKGGHVGFHAKNTTWIFTKTWFSWKFLGGSWNLSSLTLRNFVWTFFFVRENHELAFFFYQSLQAGCRRTCIDNAFVSIIELYKNVFVRFTNQNITTYMCEHTQNVSCHLLLWLWVN